MKRFCILLVLFSSFLHCAAQSLPSLHSYTANTIQGYPMTMGSFYGKKILLVNTASFCAYTPQFAKLQQLYSSYKYYNFEIIGFPCNDFGAQDPHSDSTINSFCTSNYNVTFQMMSKIEIISNDTAPIYKWLQRKNLNGVQDVSVSWNFHKFLINESGQWVAHYPSTTDPLDTAVTNWIMRPTSITVGVNELNKDLDFVELVSPNPTSSIIELQSKNEV
jgi:glutathione peroxidase